MCENHEYQIYEELGDKLVAVNYNKAYLCYEHAEFLCEDAEHRQDIQKKKDRLQREYPIQVRKTSIVIISYNCMYLMQKCLESIRKYCNPEVYEIVVVENASTDGVREWLEQQSDIKLILCDENAGFPLGCNIGIQYAEPENDIFFLNNDTRMTPNALFWLRMGLYESDDVGATGCVANYCGNDQQIDVEFLLPEQYVSYGASVNIPCDNPYEERSRLCGFAMLLRRTVLEKVQGMDVNLSPGYFDDDDITIRIGMEGYRRIVCHNAFIYHAGSQSFIERNDLESIFTKNYYYMLDKYQCDVLTNAVSNQEAIAQIQESYLTEIKILEINAGTGNTLARIKYLYPQANVYGIEGNEKLVACGVKGIPIMIGDWRTMDIPYERECFDYIIFTRGQEEELTELKVRFRAYLKQDGKFL